MAIIRDYNNSDTFLTYVSTVAFLCGISCTIIMIKFRGFKASLNVSGKRNSKQYELAPEVSVVGAYRSSREEYFGNTNYLETRKTITPSMVKLPPSSQPRVAANVTLSKSTGDLTTVQNAPADVRKSTPNVSVQNAQGSRESKNQLKEQKKLEKERLVEQKKREKLEAQEREKQEKIRKEREKQAALQRAKEEKEREKQAKEQQAKEAKEREKQKKRKGVAPQPQQQAIVQQKATVPEKPPNTTQTPQRGPRQAEAPQPPQPPQPPPLPQFEKVERRVQPHANPLSHNPAQNSTNTLESSISRTSGPPPYSDVPETVLNRTDNTGNVSYGKTAEVSSWDLISQHREQMARTVGPAVHSTGQNNIDRQYNVGNVPHDDRDNSEA